LNAVPAERVFLPMAFFGGHNLSVHETSSPATVPDNPIAKLMFYLNCINSITNLNLSRRLTNYANWRSVSQQDLAEIFAACVVLDPKTLADKGILMWDREGRICRPGENRFFSITDREVRGFIDPEVIIGGQRTTITQIMAFGEVWIRSNYLLPLAFLLEQAGITEETLRRPGYTAAPQTYTPRPPASPSRSGYRSMEPQPNCCCLLL
jgi:hypothetical protein